MENIIKSYSIYEIAVICRFLDEMAAAGNVHAEYLCIKMRYALYLKIEIENMEKGINSLITICKGAANK